MATQSVAMVGGGFAKALPTYSRGVTCFGGPELSILKPAWAGKASARKAVDWLPKIDEPVVDLTTGRMTRHWYQFVRELATRLGGLNGDGIQTIVDNLQLTQSSLLATIQYAQQVGQYAQSATTQVTALTSSAAAAGVPVASVPPPAPSPTYRPSPYELKYGDLYQ